MSNRAKRKLRRALMRQQAALPDSSTPSQGTSINNNRAGQLRVQAGFFSGPLPPPEVLVRYNEAVPDGANRIIKMAESQAVHRQELEKTALKAQISSEKRGQWLGFFIALAFIAGGVYLIATGKSTAGLTVIGCDLAALVGVFVYGKRSQSKELSRKAEPFRQK